MNWYGVMAQNHWARWLPQRYATIEDPEENDPATASGERPLVIDRSHPLWAEVNAEQQELAQDS